jgi:hypothetical protein
MKQKQRGKIYTFFYIIISALAGMMSVPFALIRQAFMTKRMRKQVQQFYCVVCYCKLDLASLDAADTYWACHMQEMHQYFPNRLIRVVRELDAVCTTCTTHYHYQEKSQKFIRIKNLESPYDVQNPEHANTMPDS